MADAKETVQKEAEERKRRHDEAIKRMESIKPTPTQEENDRARRGEDVAQKADDGSGPDPHALASSTKPKETK
jgi:hypothetical protein